MIQDPPPLTRDLQGMGRVAALCGLAWEELLTKEEPGSCCYFLHLDRLSLSLARAQNTEKQGYVQGEGLEGIPVCQHP